MIRKMEEEKAEESYEVDTNPLQFIMAHEKCNVRD